MLRTVLCTSRVLQVQVERFLGRRCRLSHAGVPQYDERAPRASEALGEYTTRGAGRVAERDRDWGGEQSDPGKAEPALRPRLDQASQRVFRSIVIPGSAMGVTMPPRCSVAWYDPSG